MTAEGPTTLVVLTRPESLARRAHASLREAIRDGVLVRDRLYSEAELAASMGVSRTPVREALRELSGEGLVEVLPQRGFRLRSLTADEVIEVFGLRLALESYVAEQLATRAAPGDVAQLRALVRRQARAMDDAGEFLVADEEFHLLMPDLIGLTRTHAILTTLRGVMWLIGAHALTVAERAERVLEEHREIVDAIEAGDPASAVAAIRHHLEATLRALGGDGAAS